ncbi:MAG: DNA polymerase I [Clostridia bacterium]|nr:DNA polymerase I [Clostridia bacterium]
MEKLVLIDGNSLLNRAFYATPPFTTKDGFPTNGIFGFIKLYLKILSDIKPDYAVVAFDMRAPTFRHKMYDKYKATRKGMPQELALQLPVLKECLNLMGVKICQKEGIEADDIVGTLSKKFDVESYIFTGDRDSYQLVDEKTHVCFTKRGVSDLLHLTLENFEEAVGLSPKQIIDLKSLMGDSSDNIPGVPGVGEKMAMKLLLEYGNLENIYENLDNISGALHKKLAENRELAFLSKQLATIDTNVELDVSLNECRIFMPFSIAVRQKFASLEFRQLYADERLYEPLISQEATADTQTEIAPKAQKTVYSYEEIREAIENNRQFSVVWGEKRCIFTDSTEYELPEQKDLFSVGISQEECEKILKALFENERNTVVLYGAKQMLHALSGYGIDFSADFEDVALLKYLVDYTGKEEELSFVLDAYAYPKEHLACSLFALYGCLKEKLHSLNMVELYNTIEKPLVRVLFSMEKEGVCVNEGYLRALGEEYVQKIARSAKRIHELAGDDTFNINSTKQLGEILFNKLALPGGKKSKSGQYSSSVEVLEKLAQEHEIAREILEYRKNQKLNSTYVEGLKNFIEAGKIHTTYTQGVTSTGRLSSKNPNLQNIPIRTEEGREIRKIFVAKENHVLLDADYSQIELRLMAHMSGCKELIEAYRADKDIHRDTAAKVYQVPEEQVTPAMRRSAKAVNFGIIYGESAFGLSQNLGITPSQASEFIQRYFNAYPAVKQYLNQTVEFAKANGYVVTLFGRKREIPELKSPNFNIRQFGERAAMNMPLQGTSADIIKIAMISVHNELKKRNLRSKLILQVHDELVIDAPQEEAQEAAAILKECMEKAVALSVPLTVEVASGKSWFDAK